ncbi:CYFA0S28e00122g1_1 [Cyberlindnera fabianii]|uniref:CYFA0S28e00122g1_1 n=1 Tax=Cyberlindnera fabianii TaxID=36022 RepID=A0A061BAX1_CYBFA|nr:CYFA0S28e00122g1_1 [Cyberlindnera fabianii]
MAKKKKSKSKVKKSQEQSSRESVVAEEVEQSVKHAEDTTSQTDTQNDTQNDLQDDTKSVTGEQLQSEVPESSVETDEEDVTRQDRTEHPETPPADPTSIEIPNDHDGDDDDDDDNDTVIRSEDDNSANRDSIEPTDNDIQSEKKEETHESTVEAGPDDGDEEQEQEQEQEKDTNTVTEVQDDTSDDADKDEDETNSAGKSSATSDKEVAETSTSNVTETEEDQVEPVKSSDIAPEDKQETEDKTSNTLISVTPGPYTLSSLHLEVPPSLGTTTAICHHENNIYLGTSLGYILTYTLIPGPEYILTSQVPFHQTRRLPVTHFLPLPTLQILLVVSGHLLQCFSLPSTSPLTIGRIKDVNSIELDLNKKAKCDENGVHVAIMTKSQLRIVNVTKQALRLVKDVKCGAICGKRREDRLIVAHDGQYEMLDIKRELNNRTMLFPVNTAGADIDQEHQLTPFVEGVGNDEFLLVCGTGKDDPAMGLVVNLKGDVSRGTIPMLSYPDSVLTDNDAVITVRGGEVTAYSLEDQRELQTWTFSQRVHVTRVELLSVNASKLVELITLKPIVGSDPKRDAKELEFAQSISKVNCSILIFSETLVETIVPQSRLERLQSVTKLKVLEKELATSQATTELTVIEVEYLNLQISLMRLVEHNYDAALESWTNGTLDPRILIYIFGYEVHGDLYIFGGLIPLTLKLRKSIKETAFNTFFELFLERWLLKHTVENRDIITTIELTTVLYHLNNPQQLIQTLKLVSTVDVVPILRQHGKHLALAHILAEREDPKSAIFIHKDLIDHKITDQGFDSSDSLHIICELSKKCDDEDFIRETGMWLLRHDAKLAISFMNSSKLSLHSLQTGMERSEEVKHVIESIDDAGLKYNYLSQVFVSMGQEKMRLNLKKGLYKSLLKSLSARESTLRRVQN